MTTILFEGTRHAYLPEIDAYRHYLAKHFPHVVAIDSRKPPEADFTADVIWRFMGLDFEPKPQGQYLVHEYNSLSTGRGARLKNYIKRMVNGRKPDQRVYLSSVVRHAFPFKDSIPSYMRDMGISPQFFTPRQKAQYDLIYVGSLDRGGIISDFLDYFAHAQKDMTLLLVGSAEESLMARYKDFAHITFTGRIPYAEVPSYMALARYGLNLMPDKYPFNLQTSTKLLEYCAAGLGIVSSKYSWSETFAADRNGGFFWLEPDFANLKAGAVEEFGFKTPDVSDLLWDNVIGQSGIFDFLK